MMMRLLIAVIISSYLMCSYALIQQSTARYNVVRRLLDRSSSASVNPRLPSPSSLWMAKKPSSNVKTPPPAQKKSPSIEQVRAKKAALSGLQYVQRVVPRENRTALFEYQEGQACRGRIIIIKS